MSTCAKPKEDAKCSDCGGAHPALYKGCQAHKEAVQTQVSLTAQKSYAAALKKPEQNVIATNLVGLIAAAIATIRVKLNPPSSLDEITHNIAQLANRILGSAIQMNQSALVQSLREHLKQIDASNQARFIQNG